MRDIQPARNRGLAGIAGLCGALLFFAGDMLFYGHWGPAARFQEGMLETVRNASLARLYENPHDPRRRSPSELRIATGNCAAFA